MLLLSNCNVVITVPSSSRRYCCCVFATVLIIVVVVVYVIIVVGVVAFWQCDIPRLLVETNYELMQNTKKKCMEITVKTG